MTREVGKIALFLPALRSGGAGRVMINLARGFTDLGLDAEIVITKGIGSFLDVVPDGIQVVSLGGETGRLPALAFHNYLRRARPSHILSTVFGANTTAPWVTRLSGLRARVVVHQETTLTEFELKGWRYKRPLRLPRMRLNYRLADAVLVNSAGSAADLVRHRVVRPERIRVVPNPVYEPEMESLAGAAAGHPWLDEKAGPVLVGAGRLGFTKDYETPIRALARVREQLPARLVILGEGPDLAPLRALAAELGLADAVAFPGFLANPHAVLARADLFVHSARWEGFGNVLVEALAAGTPVVATLCPGGPREILREGEYGRLVPVRDPAAMAEAILATLATPPDPAPLVAHARRFSIAEVAPRFLAVLRGDGDAADVYRPQ